LSLPEVSGAYVKELPSGSPAAQAGIKVDDVIVEFQGRRMDGPQQLNDEVAALPPGREVSLQVWRDGTKREIKVKLGDYAQVLAARSSELAQKDSGEPGGLKHPYGLKLVELNDTHRRNLGLSRNSQGLVIEEVEKNSSAALNGLQPGDLVLRINRQDVSTLEEATAALQRSGEDGSSIFNVWRQGRIGVFVLKKN
jgi:serine protease Do